MLWLTKRREQHFEKVKINDRVQLDVAERSYLTRVEDVSDGEVHVAAPLESTWDQDARSRERVILNVFSESGFLRYSTRISGAVYNRVPMVVLSHVRNLSSTDRRQDERVAAELPIRYRIKAGPDNIAPWSSAATSDVSGCGLRAVCDSASVPRVNDYLDIQLLLPSDDQPLKAVAQIMWAAATSRGERKPCFGARFVIIQPPERARIARFARNRRVWMQKMRREYDRTPAELPVRYRWNALDGWTQWRYTVTADVSGSGIRLQEPGLDRLGNLRVDDEVEALLSLPDGHRPVAASGRVVRLASGKKSVEAGLAVRFDSISESERKRIVSYVEGRRLKLHRLKPVGE